MSVAIARSLHRLALGASLLALVLFAGLAHAKLPAFDAGRLNFAIQANGLMLDYRVFGLYLLPGETLAIRSAVELQLQVDDGKASTTAGGWDWEAPDRAGLYPLQLLHDGEVAEDAAGQQFYSALLPVGTEVVIDALFDNQEGGDR